MRRTRSPNPPKSLRIRMQRGPPRSTRGSTPGNWTSSRPDRLARKIRGSPIRQPLRRPRTNMNPSGHRRTRSRRLLSRQVLRATNPSPGSLPRPKSNPLDRSWRQTPKPLTRKRNRGYSRAPSDPQRAASAPSFIHRRVGLPRSGRDTSSQSSPRRSANRSDRNACVLDRLWIRRHTGWIRNISRGRLCTPSFEAVESSIA